MFGNLLLIALGMGHFFVRKSSISISKIVRLYYVIYIYLNGPIEIQTFITQQFDKIFLCHI